MAALAPLAPSLHLLALPSAAEEDAGARARTLHVLRGLLPLCDLENWAP